MTCFAKQSRGVGMLSHVCILPRCAGSFWALAHRATTLQLPVCIHGAGSSFHPPGVQSAGPSRMTRLLPFKARKAWGGRVGFFCHVPSVSGKFPAVTGSHTGRLPA
jgi:hypothetical protein